MAIKTKNQLTTTTTRDSLISSRNGGQPPKKRASKRPRPRSRPVAGLLGLLAHLLIAGSGVALSVLIVHFNLQVIATGPSDLIARILLFTASCMGVLYALLHVCAARAPYVRKRAAPQVFGYFSVSVAVLLTRLGGPVWAAAVVLTALVAAQKGFDVAEGITGNVVWVQVGITSLGL